MLPGFAATAVRNMVSGTKMVSTLGQVVIVPQCTTTLVMCVASIMSLVLSQGTMGIYEINND